MKLVPGRGSGWEGRALAGLTLAGALLRLWGLSRQSIWVDETFTIAYAGIFEGMSWGRLLVNLQGPFHALLLYFWSQLWGSSEWALRSMQALIGTATIPVFYWALRPLGRPKHALLACALMAVSPFHLWYSQEVRGYVLLIFFVVVSMGAFFRLPAGGRRMWVLYTLANLLGFLSNLSYGFLAVTQSGLLFVRRRERIVRRMALSLAVTGLLLSPWLFQFWQRNVRPTRALEFRPVPKVERMRGETTSPLLGIPYTYAVFSLGYSYGPSLREYHAMSKTGWLPLLGRYAWAMIWAAAAFSVVACWGAARLIRQGGRPLAWCCLAVLPVLLTYGVATRNLKVMNPRYGAAAFPAYLVVLAEGLLAPRRRWGSYALAGAILLPMGISLVQYQTVPRYFKEDARGVAAELAREARPGDVLFLVGTDLPFRLYYWRRAPKASFDLPVEDAWLWAGRSPEEQHRRFEEMWRDHRRVLVLSLRPKEVDPQGNWAEYIQSHHPPEETRGFTGAQLSLLAGGRP